MIAWKTQLDRRYRLLHYRGVTGNLYLVADTEAASTVLVDCGMPADLPGLLDVLSDLPPLERVVCTHFHIDHVGGWRGLKKQFPDLTIWFREPARPWVCGQRRLPPPGIRVLRDLFWPVMREYDYRPAWRDIRATGFYGTGFRPGFPTNGVRFFSDDEHLLPGFDTLPTPGHRPEHTAFWHPDRRILICGDCLLHLDGRVLTENFLSSPVDQALSLDRIRRLGPIDHLCPGHGRCVSWDPAAGER